MQTETKSNILADIIASSEKTNEVELLRRYIKMVCEYAATMENAIQGIKTELGGERNER